MLNECLQFSSCDVKESFPSQCALADVVSLARGAMVNADAYLTRRVTGEAKYVLPCGTHRGTVLTREGAYMNS